MPAGQQLSKMISQETINVPQVQRPWIDAITHQLFLAIVHKVENNAASSEGICWIFKWLIRTGN